MYTFGSGCDILTLLWERGDVNDSGRGGWVVAREWPLEHAVFAEDQGVLVRASIAVTTP